MKQIKSKKRVSDFGEVFTNPREVKAMCDLVPQDTWTDITKTFLEPACGNGNFLAEIFERKLKYCNNVEDAITALSSIYGIDIQEDNAVESRTRLLKMFTGRYSDCYGTACRILEHNIVVGDFLKPTSIPWLEEACIEAGVSTEDVPLWKNKKQKIADTQIKLGGV